MIPKGCFAHCNYDFCHKIVVNNPAGCLSPTIYSFQFPSIQGVGGVGSRTTQYPRSVVRIKWHILTILLISSMLSFFYPMVELIYYIFIEINLSYSCNILVLITYRLFKWRQATTAPLDLLLRCPSSEEGDNPSMTRMSIAISAGYQTIMIIVEMSIQNPLMSPIGDHWGMWLGHGHQ